MKNHPGRNFNLKKKFHRSGLTLMELMIAVTIFTVGILGAIGAFANIAKSITFSRATSLASNLAQEKIEMLKNLSYYRLLVTTAPVAATESGTTGFNYDSGIYKSEDMNVGQINFTRRVFIEKVTESAGVLNPNNWWDTDTGLKRITVYVIWPSGTGYKQYVLTSLRDDPNRKKIDATFTGTVSASTGGVLLNVDVDVLENPQYTGTTNSLGVYSIGVPAGTYQLNARKKGYFPVTMNGTVASKASQTVDFSLPPMGYGTVTGVAYLNTHLVISELCVSVDGDPNLEYVELYNPTSMTLTMATGLVGSYRVEYVRKSDGNVVGLSASGRTIFNTASIAPGHYYLIASSPVVKGVLADAYYSDTFLSGSVPSDKMPNGESGGVRIISEGVYESSGTTVDAVGWGRGASPWGPVGAIEANGIHLTGTPGFDGLATEEVLERKANSSSDHLTMDVFPAAGTQVGMGNAYDMNDNDVDFVHHMHTDNDLPQNVAVLENPISGGSAAGAYVFLDDGLSSSALVQSTGNFTVTSVATGTWSIVISSSGYIYNGVGLVVTNGITLDIGTVYISTVATNGFASGRVTNTSNVPLAGINIQTSGGLDTTDSLGYYRLRLDVGTYTVTANANNANIAYTVGTATGVVVNAGAQTEVPDIIISNGGALTGFVTPNGTDPLPGVALIATATASGLERGSAVTDSSGRYRFADLPVGNYIISPQMEVGESASPSNVTVTVSAGTTVTVATITISNAFGTVTGSVTSSGRKITTGVVIMAVLQPTTVLALPPSITDAVRSAPTVYYAGTSDSDGTYSILLRGGTYNLYGWYTTFNGSTPTTTKVTQVVTVPSGGSTTVNLSW